MELIEKSIFAIGLVWIICKNFKLIVKKFHKLNIYIFFESMFIWNIVRLYFKCLVYLKKQIWNFIVKHKNFIYYKKVAFGNF